MPPYPGNVLDPPLRSQFQSKFIPKTPTVSQIKICRSLFPTVPESIITSICLFPESIQLAQGWIRWETILTQVENMPELQLSATKLLDFPDNGIFSFLKTLELFPKSSQQLILKRIYPFIFVAQDSAQ